MRKIVLAVSCVLAMASVFLVAPEAVTAQAQARAAQISIQDALRIATDKGIRDIREVELTRNRWEIEGRDARGRRVEVYIDARSGQILKIELK